MESTLQTVFSGLALLGIGGIIGSYISFRLDTRKILDTKQLELKQTRYKSCLLFMDAYFEPQNIKYIMSRQSDVKTSEDIIEYLKAEYHEMLLYASKDVLVALQNFVKKPTRTNFLKTVLSMRKDLWLKADTLTLEDINASKFFSKAKNS